MENSGNNKYSNYNVGYNPEAVEHDLQLISQLTNGKYELTMNKAQKIYYRIKSENIEFESDTGKNFLDKLYDILTDEQIQRIDTSVMLKKRKKNNMRRQRKRLFRINRRIAIVMTALVFISTVLCINWNFLMDIRTNYKTKKLLEKLESVESETKVYVQTNETEPIITDVEEDTATEESVIVAKFAELYSENNDFVGWLKIPGTKIDYPVMSKEGDNDYYLDKNFEQQQDKNGLLILDYRSDVTASGQNLIIYGHNMRSGVMFGTLKNYKDRKYCDEHPVISFDNLYEECDYKIVAVMLSDVAYEDEDVFRYYDAIDISTEEKFNEFKKNIIDNALYITDETIEFGDSCLLLSTCDNYKEDGRFVVIAKKMI